MKPRLNGESSGQQVNKILPALPKRSDEWLQSLEAVTLQPGMVLYESEQAIEHVYFLGTRRASVTVAAGLMQRAGLIKTSRGQITLLDPRGLESMACECYGILRDHVRRLQTS